MVTLLGFVRRWWRRLFGGRFAEGHEPHTKEVQLGYEPSEDDEDPEILGDDADLDAVWADATTVEDYASDLLLLADLDPAIIDALRADREGR